MKVRGNGAIHFNFIRERSQAEILGSRRLIRVEKVMSDSIFDNAIVEPGGQGVYPVEHDLIFTTHIICVFSVSESVS